MGEKVAPEGLGGEAEEEEVAVVVEGAVAIVPASDHHQMKPRPPAADSWDWHLPQAWHRLLTRVRA